MKAERRRIYAVLILSIVLVLSLTGCKASKKKVLSSSYYKELKKENKKLKNWYEKFGFTHTGTKKI